MRNYRDKKNARQQKPAKSSPPSRDLHATGDLLRAMTQTSPECIKVVAADGRLLQMNPAGLAMIDADCWESVAHAATFDLVAPEHRKLWLANHQRVCAGEALCLGI